MKMKKKASSKGARGTDIRGEVLRLALQALAAGNESDLSFRKLARKLGIQHNTVVYHFGDSERLYIAIATEGFKTLAGTFAKVAAEAKTPRDRLAGLGKAYLGFAMDNPGQFRAMFGAFLSARAPQDADLVVASDAAKTELHRTCRELVLEQRPKATSTEVENLTRSSVIQYWSMVHGMAVLWIDGPMGFHFKLGAEGYNEVCSGILSQLPGLVTRDCSRTSS